MTRKDRMKNPEYRIERDAATVRRVLLAATPMSNVAHEAFGRILAEVDELHRIAEQATQRGMAYQTELTLEKQRGEALRAALERIASFERKYGQHWFATPEASIASEALRLSSDSEISQGEET